MNDEKEGKDQKGHSFFKSKLDTFVYLYVLLVSLLLLIGTVFDLVKVIRGFIGP